MGAADKAARRKAVVEAAQKDRAREKRVDWLIRAGGLGGVAAVVLALVYLVGENWTRAQTIEYLDVADTERLQTVLFGGLPWLVLCSDSRKALKDGQLREPLLQTASRLATDDAETAIHTAVLDCSKELPSGKTVYDRLVLNETRAPGLELTKTVRDKVNKRFRLAHIRDTETLTKHCLKRKQCTLFLGYGDPLPATKALARRMRQEYPLMRWAHLDRVKYSLSAEKEILQAHDVPRKRQMAIFFKHGAFRAMAPDDGGHVQESELRAFLYGLDKDENADRLHDPLPSVKIARKPSKSGSSSSKPAAEPERRKTKKKEAPSQSQDVDPAERARREQERRKEMDQAAQDFEPVYVDEEEDDDDAGVNDEDEDDEEDEEDAQDKDDELVL
ncbi:Hypothetical Protein FCC1311_039782 [Hondaea fermentalgiana]|uniref:Uncharacterized protein n=1 Tax=Hondaea fermentalgiana TaxID=2315210 RepID=A0A2R5GAY5_9STRA|nr:Hypothetical Protein FCC1311_039782 [Hondaea fermentalgiana]|eukprot:GBG27755.1 Hypothetical Protein FCC1311_039782 [Hondaea fermentalgiana]